MACLLCNFYFQFAFSNSFHTRIVPKWTTLGIRPDEFGHDLVAKKLKRKRVESSLERKKLNYLHMTKRKKTGAETSATSVDVDAPPI